MVQRNVQALIQAHYPPKPAGVLPGAFDDAVSAPNARAQQAEFDLAMHSLRAAEAGDDVTAGGQQAINVSSTRDERADKSKKRDREYDKLLHAALRQSLQNYMDGLEQQIDDYESGFEARYGDAWREIMANRIMDPDEIPQRREGESMEAYRERLERELIARMIDPATGEIRPEYRGDPEMAEWAAWAKAQWDLGHAQAAAEVINDPSASDEDIEQAVDELEARTGFNGLRQAEQILIEADTENEAIAEATNEAAYDASGSVSVSAGDNAFKL